MTETAATRASRSSRGLRVYGALIALVVGLALGAVLGDIAPGLHENLVRVATFVITILAIVRQPRINVAAQIVTILGLDTDSEAPMANFIVKERLPRGIAMKFPLDQFLLAVTVVILVISVP